MYISTLRRHVEAMGGELEITARFPDGTVKIRYYEKEAEQGGAGSSEIAHRLRPQLSSFISA
jgi:hypothetical protein